MAFGKIKLDELPRRAQFAIVAALAIGLVAVAYAFYFRDLLETRSALQTEIAQLQATVAQTGAVQRQLSQFKRDLAELDVRLNELRRILPSQKETPDVLRAVQQMAAASNLKIVRFEPKPIAPHTFYLDWPISMEVEGSYNALGTFFEKVGQYTRVVNVDNISVKNVEGSTDPSRTLHSNYTATTFVYREDQGTVPGK
jgi:Tfp pilus assembly protein PilO